MTARRLPVLEFDPATMPRTRADCLPVGRIAARFCPWTVCRHSLAAEGSTGESCVLDVLDREGSPPSLDAIGQFLGLVTRERVRQIEAQALRKLARKPGRVYSKLRSMGEP